MSVAAGSSVGHARFELFLPLPTTVGVALSGAAVSASTWAARAAPVLAGAAVPLALSVGTGGENSG